MACERIDIEQEQSSSANKKEEQTTTAASYDAFRTERHPKVCSLWNGHAVVFSDAFHPDSCKLTLLSLYEWEGLPSAYNTEDPDIAILIAETYEEEELSDWHIPTTAEAKLLHSLYNSGTQVSTTSESTTDSSDFVITIDTPTTGLTALNMLLQSLNTPVIGLKNGNTNIRYLCDEAYKSFSFISNTSIANGGKKLATYHLRLVKTVTISVETNSDGMIIE